MRSPATAHINQSLRETPIFFEVKIMNFRMSEKALVAIVSLFFSFQFGRMSEPRPQSSMCSVPLPETISIPLSKNGSSMK